MFESLKKQQSYNTYLQQKQLQDLNPIKSVDSTFLCDKRDFFFLKCKIEIPFSPYNEVFFSENDKKIFLNLQQQNISFYFKIILEDIIYPFSTTNWLREKFLNDENIKKTFYLPFIVSQEDKTTCFSVFPTTEKTIFEVTKKNSFFLPFFSSNFLDDPILFQYKKIIIKDNKFLLAEENNVFQKTLINFFLEKYLLIEQNFIFNINNNFFSLVTTTLQPKILNLTIDKTNDKKIYDVYFGAVKINNKEIE